MLRSITERLKCAHEEYHSYNTAFHGIVNEHPLLASYSNIFVILYASLKELTKITGEITYSWKIYIKLIDMIIAKIIRDLTMNLKNKEDSSDGEDEEGDNMTPPANKREKRKPKNDREFTIDEEFFHSVIMPSIYSTILAGIRQENIGLFNLVFSLEIALKKTTVTREDIEFYLFQFFKMPEYKDWRNQNKNFVNNSDNVDHDEYHRLKSQLLKHYPDTRKAFEIIDIQLGSSFSYKDLSGLVYKRILREELKEESLMKKINFALICPNDEFRALLCHVCFMKNYQQSLTSLKISQNYITLLKLQVGHFLSHCSQATPLIL